MSYTQKPHCTSFGDFNTIIYSLAGQMLRRDGDNNAERERMLLLRQQAENSSSMWGGSSREEKVLYKLLPR